MELPKLNKHIWVNGRDDDAVSYYVDIRLEMLSGGAPLAGLIEGDYLE